MHYLITGGAGFIGSNYVYRLLDRGERVTIYDNLSRRGATANLDWLRETFGANAFTLIHGDVRDATLLAAAVRDVDVIVHLASQVAVTSSVLHPREDFEINVTGTFNVLEAARLVGNHPAVIFASTNKVYGGMESLIVEERETRYAYRDYPHGIPETYPLDFHSPYGCSKGSGDQYVRDYARIYGLRTVVFRQSCIAAEQEVVTPFGKKKMAALTAGDFVQSGTGWTRVRHVWQTGVKPVRRITTMGGAHITLTADHKVFRPHGLYTSQHLAYGDFVAVLPEALHTPEWEAIAEQVLDRESYLTAVQARTPDLRCYNEAQRIAEQLLPLTGDRLLAIAEVVGWLFGDGHLGIHQRQSREAPAYTVQYFGSQDELQNIRDVLTSLGLPAPKATCWDSASEMPDGYIIEGTSCRIQQQSIPCFTLFEMLGVPVGDKVRVAYGLPQWVMTGHRLVKRAFLRGFFGAELCKVNPNSYLAPSFAQSKDITHLENGRLWMQQLRALLEEFGITTSYFEAEPVEYKRGTTVQMTVRLLGGCELHTKLAAIGYAFNAERTEKLNALLRWGWTHTAPTWFEQTYQLYHADGPLFWDSVATIEQLDAQPVYDLEVESPAHMLVAGAQISNCIYGTRQFGVEDQGWVAWFIIAALLGRPITIYGDGKQVRDLLYVDDLLNAYDAAIANIDQVAGQIYNVGGGAANQLSVWREFCPLLERLTGREIPVSWRDWRPGDQRIFVADIRKAAEHLHWHPAVGVEEGITRLFTWVKQNQALFTS